MFVRYFADVADTPLVTRDKHSEIISISRSENVEFEHKDHFFDVTVLLFIFLRPLEYGTSGKLRRGLITLEFCEVQVSMAGFSTLRNPWVRMEDIQSV